MRFCKEKRTIIPMPIHGSEKVPILERIKRGALIELSDRGAFRNEI